MSEQADRQSDRQHRMLDFGQEVAVLNKNDVQCIGPEDVQCVDGQEYG